MKFDDLPYIERLAIVGLFHTGISSDFAHLTVQEFNLIPSDCRLTNPKGVRFAKIRGEWKRVVLAKPGSEKK
jgi:hypothetical protein